MKKLIAVLLLMAGAAHAQTFTSSVQSITWTGVTVLAVWPGATSETLRVEGDGSRWTTRARVHGTNQAGVSKSIVIVCDIGQPRMLAALATTLGVTNNSTATNIIKKYDKILLNALTADANRALDQLQ